MEKVDYIIVGDGYAAMFFAHQLIKNNKRFKLFSASQRAASHISAGVCNPVVLKRFVEIWKAKEQLETLPIVFNEIKAYTGRNYLIDEQVVRVFHDENEKEIWLNKRHNGEISEYLNPDFLHLTAVINNNDAGKVNESCRIDVDGFFTDMFRYLDEQGFLVRETFNYNDLDIEDSSYQNIKFDHIVFAEGVAVNDNPFFDTIPVKGNKGHCLRLRINEAIDPFIIKKKHFLFRWKDDTFFVGGTYERGETDDAINPKSVQQLEDGLREIYDGQYEITEKYAAFRAVVSDRRPILGRHNLVDNYYVFNGLGARGVFNGSFGSQQLFDFIEYKKPLDPEVDVQRFYNKKSND